MFSWCWERVAWVGKGKCTECGWGKSQVPHSSCCLSPVMPPRFLQLCLVAYWLVGIVVLPFAVSSFLFLCDPTMSHRYVGEKRGAPEERQGGSSQLQLPLRIRVPDEDRGSGGGTLAVLFPIPQMSGQTVLKVCLSRSKGPDWKTNSGILMDENPQPYIPQVSPRIRDEDEPPQAPEHPA